MKKMRLKDISGQNNLSVVKKSFQVDIKAVGVEINHLGQVFEGNITDLDTLTKRPPPASASGHEAGIGPLLGTIGRPRPRRKESPGGVAEWIRGCDMALDYLSRWLR